MFKYSKDGVNVEVILDTRREKENGSYPVKIRVTYRRERKYYNTGKDLTPDEWDKLPATKSQTLIKLRKDLENSYNIIRAIVEELVSDAEFSFDNLNIRLGNKADYLNEIFVYYIEELKDEGRIGSMENYRNALKSVEAFAGKKIKLTDVTPVWLKKYEKYMLGLGRSYTTIGMYARAIRIIINRAIRTGQLKQGLYPFGVGKYEIPTSEGRKLALSMEQIKKLISYTDGLETTERYRDLWFFSYLCNGANFNDMLRLRYSDIQDGEICFMRGKTARTSRVKKEIRAIITPPLQALIDRWGNPDKRPGNYIFPYLKGGETPQQEKDIIRDVTKRCNKRLKLIGRAIGIEGITTYSARHSFATVLKRSGTNIAFISESLGHSDLKTTENYLASFEKEERQKNAELLTKF